ncbi:MAG: MATE family efflux transporter, partial [Bacilli bacterium]
MLFSLPFLLGNLLQAVYGAADIYVVGIYSGAAAVSGVAIGSQLLQMVTNVITGTGIGGNVLIAQRMGAQDYKGCAKAIGTLSLIFLMGSLIITLVLYLNVPNIVKLMNTPLDAQQQAIAYLRICSLGIPFITGYNALSAILRGLGNSKSPVYFIALACLINIIMDFILVGYFKLEASGAAWATTFSQAISFICGLMYFKKNGLVVPFDFSYFKVDIGSLKRILKIGFPIALQGFLISISFLIITALINNLGLIASASVGVVQKIIGFAMLPAMSFAGAIATMTAQNIGAKQPLRAIKALKMGICFSLIFGVSFCMYAQIWPENITGLFTNDQEIIYLAATYLKSFSIDCILVSFIFCMNSYFNGCGKSLVSFSHSIAATFLIRIPLSFILSQYATNSLYIMGLAAPLASFFSLIVCLI